MEPLVSTAWLAERLGEPDLVVVDASLHMAGTGRSGRDEYLAAHIPGARFLDIEELSDRSNPAPHMLPSAAEFAEAMERLGVASDDRIVVYDNSALRSAARGWFMLRHFGAREVAILDGGMQAWLADGRPTEAGEAPPRTATFVPREQAGAVVSKDQVLTGSGAPLLDARATPRFEGREPDPRPGIAAGQIPGSRNLPFAALYAEDGRFKPREELRRLFAQSGVDPARPFVASCGSGVTANSLIFAAHLLGHGTGRLYDGSWSEWGADPKTPKAVGPA